jgi:hypothetical protein
MDSSREKGIKLLINVFHFFVFCKNRIIIRVFYAILFMK